MSAFNTASVHSRKDKSAHQDYFDDATLKVLEEVFNQFDKVKIRSRLAWAITCARRYDIPQAIAK